MNRWLRGERFSCIDRKPVCDDGRTDGRTDKHQDIAYAIDRRDKADQDELIVHYTYILI